MSYRVRFGAYSRLVLLKINDYFNNFHYIFMIERSRHFTRFLKKILIAISGKK